MIAIQLHDGRTVHPNCATAARGELKEGQRPYFFAVAERAKTILIRSRKSKLIKRGQRCAHCNDTI